jgi:hypothetical protein
MVVLAIILDQLVPSIDPSNATITLVLMDATVTKRLKFFATIDGGR